MTIKNKHRILHKVILGACLVTIASSCATTEQRTPSHYCQSQGILLDARFEGGQLGQCQIAQDGSFKLTLFPEDAPPINDSPWYAMRVSGKAGQQLTLNMSVDDGTARYWPKISHDGENWQPLEKQSVKFSEDGNSMSVKMTLESAQTWLAGQPLLTSEFYAEWNRELEALPHADTRLAGRSAQGRPIFVTQTADRDEALLLIGRQHPPELTGAIAMRPFVDTVLGPSELAKQFRQRFKVMVFPVLNPDGIALGHWRHNTGGADLNRDWGPFTQPETQLVKRWLDGFDQTDMQLRLMLDFHSTQKNLLYTQLAEDPADPPGFATRWLSAFAERMPEYEFKHDARAVNGRPTSKNYFYTTYGIPAITHETGDETAPELISEAAVIYAEEMMKALLSYPPPE